MNWVVWALEFAGVLCVIGMLSVVSMVLTDWMLGHDETYDNDEEE